MVHAEITLKNAFDAQKPRNLSAHTATVQNFLSSDRCREKLLFALSFYIYQ